MFNNLIKYLTDRFNHNSKCPNPTTDIFVNQDFENQHQINQAYSEKYPDLKLINTVIDKPVNDLNEFQTNLNLTKYTIKSEYGQTIIKYLNAQCQVRRQYQLNQSWASQTNIIVHRILKKFESQYTSEPLKTLKTQILPELKKELDTLSNNDLFKNNHTIKTYQNRIKNLKDLSDEKLSLKLIEDGYDLTLVEIANQNFDEYGIVHMWSHQLQTSFNNIEDLKTKLMMIVLNNQIVQVFSFITNKIIDDEQTFINNQILLQKLKQTHQTNESINQIINYFDTKYQFYKKQLAENKQNDYGRNYYLIQDWNIDGREYHSDIYDYSNKYLVSLIESYLIEN